jgi:3-phenylpropionate/cinnamic acid dioxygenase small subunit
LPLLGAADVDSRARRRRRNLRRSRARAFDDNKGTLTLRVKRLATNFAYAEDPPSRTVRVVSNVQTEEGGNGEVKAFSNLILYRTRLETTTDIFAGRREDLLRRNGAGFNIASRKVVLAVNVLPSNNLSVFF